MIKDITGYEGLYQIDEFGSVFATGCGMSNNSTQRELKSYRCGKDRNYLSVRLYKEGIKKDYRVHRLVAENFITNPNKMPQVNHIDKDTFNNHVDNLEWCSAQYNKEYSASKIYTFKNPHGEVVEVFNLSKFCRDNGLSNGCLYHLISGKYKQHKGWSLIEPS